MITSTPEFNPFSNENSSYINAKEWKQLHAEGQLTSAQAAKMELFQQYVQHPDFPCIGGQAILKNGNYGVGFYDNMLQPEAAEAVCHDLLKFVEDFSIKALAETPSKSLQSFVAIFHQPEIPAGPESAIPLHTLLKHMHEYDKQHFAWTSASSQDVESPDFSFSIGGVPFFLVFLHPHTFMKVRQTPEGLTIVLFNPQYMFEALKKCPHAKMGTVFNFFETKIRDNVQKIEPLHPHISTQGEGKSAFYQVNAEAPDHGPMVQEIIDEIYGGKPFEHETE